MLKTAIIGGSGYTGNELLRILLQHPEVEVTAVTSERHAGSRISDVFLQIRNNHIRFENANLNALSRKADLFFLCLPHKTAQKIVAELHKAGKRVIDFSADYRIKRAKLYEKWYSTPHLYPGLLRKAVYGLPEIYREKIRGASIIANPGCYPVSAILGLAPALDRNIIDPGSIIIDSKSGTSGAGRGPSRQLMFCEVNEAVRAYKIASHRHIPEIEQELGNIAGSKINIIFTPHLMPMDRGILSTIYVTLKQKISWSSIHMIYRDFYSREPFVRVLDKGVYPTTKAVKGTNCCDLSVFVENRSGNKHVLIIVSAIDNLIKGASGTAVHNMNLMYGFDETAALSSASPSP